MCSSDLIALQLGQVEENRDLAEVVTVNLRQSSTLLKQYATPLFVKYLEVIAGVISDGQKQGVFRTDLSPRVAARALYGGVDGIIGPNSRKAVRAFQRSRGLTPDGYASDKFLAQLSAAAG